MTLFILEGDAQKLSTVQRKHTARNQSKASVYKE